MLNGPVSHLSKGGRGPSPCPENAITITSHLFPEWFANSKKKELSRLIRPTAIGLPAAFFFLPVYH